ncbi:unnamed protein product [Sympodiomycopsis kandeliae]
MPHDRASPLVTPQPSTPPNSRYTASAMSPSSHASSTGFGLFSGAASGASGWPTPPTHASSGSGLFSGGPSTQVQWGATPTPLPASVQWGSNPSYSSPLKQQHSTTASASSPYAHARPSSPHMAQPLPDRSRKSESKRKRFDDEDDDMDSELVSASSPSRNSPWSDSLGVSAGADSRQLAGRNLVPKRMRAGLGGVRGIESGSYHTSSSPQPVSSNDVDLSAKSGGNRSTSDDKSNDRNNQSNEEADLGKMLASLDKPHLLSLLSSLLTQNPSLTPTIRSLLPLPTLDFVNSSLDSYETSIKAALPFEAIDDSGYEGGVRPEYAWNRLRGPVAELVAGIQSWMDFFSSKEAQDAGQGKEVHPATMFQLLHTITMRTIKIQRDLLPVVPPSILSTSTARDTVPSSNINDSPMTQHLLSSLPAALRSPASPNLLLTTLLPLLLQSWESFLRRISHDLNVKGKMYGREVITGWLRGCETLRQEVDKSSLSTSNDQRSSVSKTIAHCLEEIDQGFRREIGWCVGIY